MYVLKGITACSESCVGSYYGLPSQGRCQSPNFSAYTKLVNIYLATQTELLDSFTERNESILAPTMSEPDIIGVREATFAWDLDTSAADTPGTGRRNFKLHIENELVFKRGQINLIVGPTGCGKTSLLMALLG